MKFYIDPMGRIEPKDLLGKLTRKLIVSLMRSSYRLATHRFVLRLISQTVFEELQRNFREDNRPTTLAFMVEETLHGSRMDHNGHLYKELAQSVGKEEKHCPKCNGTGEDYWLDTCSKCMGLKTT